MAGTIDIRDQVTPILQGLAPALRRQVAPAIGAAVVVLFQDHFAGLPDNRNNWPSTGFWAQCARATNYNVLAEQVDINVDKQGFRQRLQGGAIKAKSGGWLTIPARAEAYGKRAREFSNLEAVFFQTSHGFFGALVESGSQDVSFGRKKKDGTRTVKPGAERGGGVMFWLKKSVTQKPNPAVLPTDAQITAAINETVTGIVDRIKQRGGNAA
jgi:hypothetical protein